MADKIKIVLALLLAAAGLVGFYYFSDGAMIVRVGTVLAGLVAALVVFWFTAQGRQFYAFSQESVAETKKVVWPTRKETMQTTGVVVLFMVVMALFLWAVDATLLWLVKMLMGQGE